MCSTALAVVFIYFKYIRAVVQRLLKFYFIHSVVAIATISCSKYQLASVGLSMQSQQCKDQLKTVVVVGAVTAGCPVGHKIKQDRKS